MRRLVGILIVLALLVVAYFVVGELFERTNADVRTIDDRIERLEVDITAGSVTVRATDRDDVRVRTVRTYAFLKPSTSADLDDGELHLKGTCRLIGRCSVRYEIDVPKDVVLDLQTSAGDIEISGASGRVVAKTSAGAIDGEDLESRVVEASTSAGDIELEFNSAPDDLDLKTSAGDIDVVVPDDDAYRVDTDTSAGDADVGIASDPDADRVIKARTSAGDISLRPARTPR